MPAAIIIPGEGEQEKEERVSRVEGGGEQKWEGGQTEGRQMAEARGQQKLGVRRGSEPEGRGRGSVV